MRTFWHDIRYGLCSLGRRPGFTAAVVLTLALGIGANTGIFTIFEQVLLRSLPVRDPGALVLVRTQGRSIGTAWGSTTLSYPMFQDFQASTALFEGVFCRRGETAAVDDGRGAERIEIELVSASYFEVLGVRPVLGRTFIAADEAVSDAQPVAVLSHEFWQNRFGGDRAVLGRTLLVNGVPTVVVGVAAANFRGVSLDARPKVFLPVTMKKQITPSWRSLDDRKNRWVQVFGRLPPGLSLAQAAAAVQARYRQLIEGEAQSPEFADVPAPDREQFLQSRTLLLPAGRGASDLSSNLRPTLHLLMGLAALVLVAACASASSLLIARAMSRQKEITVRLALGAGRGRIFRQVLAESLLLAAGGGLAALAIAFWTTHGILLFASGPLKAALSPALNGRMLAFNLAVSAAAALLFGLFPAWWATRVDLVGTLKDQAAAVVGGSGTRLRQALVALQVGLSLVLLIGSGLLLRSLVALYRVDPGFRTTNLVSFHVNPGLSGYDGQRTSAFWQRLRTQLQSVPGVESVALAQTSLLGSSRLVNGIVVEGYQPREGEDVRAYCDTISRDYRQVLGMSLKLGRDFTAQDELPGARQVLLVNEAFVQWFFDGRNPLGYQVGFRWSADAQPDREIVGVVGDARPAGPRRAAEPQVFVPYPQIGLSSMAIYVRTSLASAQVFHAIRAHVRQLDASIPVVDMMTMGDRLDRILAGERLVGFLASLFGALATVLALVGLYAVTAYSVTRRVQEIGIRMALGARRGHVLALVLREGMILAAVGMGAGLAVAWALTRVLRSQLFETTPTDPVTFVLTALLLGMVALLACSVPAYRAARIDPMAALRHE
ncbi:MAG: ABC transporter permease [Planctomycetes bacterium]|jgi:predicted permease|nr:ABC transporter permease [Planctomycetota bacterium]